jgi:hypothetical protein
VPEIDPEGNLVVTVPSRCEDAKRVVVLSLKGREDRDKTRVVVVENVLDEKGKPLARLEPVARTSVPDAQGAPRIFAVQVDKAGVLTVLFPVSGGKGRETVKVWDVDPDGTLKGTRDAEVGPLDAVPVIVVDKDGGRTAVQGKVKRSGWSAKHIGDNWVNIGTYAFVALAMVVGSLLKPSRPGAGPA